MEQSTNYILKNTYSIQQTQTITKSKHKKTILCNECSKKRKPLDENHEICKVCYKAKKIFNVKSGNKVIDDFIKYTQTDCTTNTVRKMEFVPYDRFENAEFIAEGGFSKIYKAIWIDSPYSPYSYLNDYPIVLKKLNNSKNVTSKELNELKIFYEFSLKRKYNHGKCISEYFGITQDPITQEIMIIMPYYKSGDLSNYFINKDFYSISWYSKLNSLQRIILGLKNLHEVNIVHRDLHSGNIFFDDHKCDMTLIGDFGISKSATELSTDDNNNEIYGIIPYMAPEIFKEQKYTTASDIYSFGMIMWEFMTGRRPFWDKDHDTELIIKICDGLRPPIATNAPEGYIDLMNECWHPDPKKRPSAIYIYEKFEKMRDNERKNNYGKTKIIKSPDIGPVTTNNPGAIYKSRLLSGMIQSAMSTRSSRSQSINLEIIDSSWYYQKSKTFYDKRKFEDQIENNFFNKKLKLIEDENNNYITKVDVENDYEYKTQETYFDIFLNV